MLSPVPGFARSLAALATILQKAEAHCTAKGIKPEVLLNDRLYPDMFPLTRQVQIACDHAKGACTRLAGVETPSHPDTETTFPELIARVHKVRDLILAIPETAFDGAETRTITLKMRGQDLSMPGQIYLAHGAIPNFYFHMTTAYNILRHRGVEVGKGDFLGN
jgi:hypothetical protein